MRILRDLVRRWLVRSDHQLSDRWLKDLDRQAQRIDFQGPRWNWTSLIEDRRRRDREVA